MPEVPLGAFRSCVFTASEAAEWAYRSQVALAGIRFVSVQESHTRLDLVTFACIVAFAFKFKAERGQRRMTKLMRTILQDGVLYFFVMAGFHIAMVFSTAFSRVITSPLLVEEGI